MPAILEHKFAMDALTERAMEIALDQVGTREVGGNNRGPVEKYLRWLGLPPGSAYCVAGALWCYNEAAKEMGVRNPFPRTGGVVRLWSLAPKWMRSCDPTLGAVFCHRSSKDPTKGHAGIVVGVSDNEIATIEFNTNAAGSRDGDGVWQKSRPRSYVNIGYVSVRNYAAGETA